MKLKTTRIRAGNWAVCHHMEAFCQEHFGPGGTQAGRRWFYRLLSPMMEEIFHDPDQDRTRLRRYPVIDRTEDFTMVYFRNPSDAMWFQLKFRTDVGA